MLGKTTLASSKGELPHIFRLLDQRLENYGLGGQFILSVVWFLFQFVWVCFLQLTS